MKTKKPSPTPNEIRKALIVCLNNRDKAANMLGIYRYQLSKLCARYGIGAKSLSVPVNERDQKYHEQLKSDPALASLLN